MARAKLKLVKGLSYSAEGFSVSKDVPFVVEADEADQLMQTGRFVKMCDVPDPEPEEEDEDSSDGQEENQDEDHREDSSPESAKTTESEERAADPESEENPEKENAPVELTAYAVNHMKKDELEALAQEKEIDISDCKNNQERAERINGALGLVDFAKLFGAE